MSNYHRWSPNRPLNFSICRRTAPNHLTVNCHEFDDVRPSKPLFKDDFCLHFVVELPNIAGESYSGRKEEKQCPPEHSPATKKNRAGQKPEVANPPKLSQPETE
ncbi:unnamed protein product [Hymenolepis diminuta]|uniref:Uncharacterized protein n=1 Tax=Hymenolepis diminuta TaxID=6216 RepID=A0A0R3SIG6_HYMDI|nr:unnamed protein product [Hymenolepis diminuta]VUZ50260.1 unnamed protein product [Hymenolepis diminuta]